jgi:nucleoside-diphosphate-sugar epimerase
VFGDGTTRRDYTYVDDIIAGVRAAMDYDRTSYEVINLGESRTVELRELIALLEEALGAQRCNRSHRPYSQATCLRRSLILPRRESSSATTRNSTSKPGFATL